MVGDAKGALEIYNDRSVKAMDGLEKDAENLIAAQSQLMQQTAALGAASVTADLVDDLDLPVLSDLAEGAKQITSASSQVASSRQGLAQGASE